MGDIAVPFGAWGKADRTTDEVHHLAHHSADVAAVFQCLLEHPTYRARAEAALGQALTRQQITCLAALAFLHDLGKLAPAFQALAWPKGHGLRTRGHLECGWIWLAAPRPEALAGAAAHLGQWPSINDWFSAIFAHHGRPTAPPGEGLAANAFPVLAQYDWREEEVVLGKALLAWFPEITTARPPDPTPAFVHFFCGLLTLADWVGSDRGGFPYVPVFQTDYWQTALKSANHRLAAIGLTGRLALKRSPEWALISDHSQPRPAQLAVEAVAVTERLVLLEAETGSGKTEAALWRFAKLVAAGEVEALYFAVPSRAAARQLHHRVNLAIRRMFNLPPEAVLAIPGQATAGEAQGQMMPDFKMLWDDAKDAPGRWAAEHSARYLAATVAIGTVDQVALGGLQVKFAHLRGAALSRALLVVDEVHASDPYMTEVQGNMIRSHLSLGGHALLMSATLGAAARRKWRSETPNDLATDSALAYPAVWTSAGLQPVAADAGSGKTVQIAAQMGWTGEDAAHLARDAAA